MDDLIYRAVEVSRQYARTAPLKLAAPRLDVDVLLADPATRIIVRCRAGGVGKTTLWRARTISYSASDPG